MPDPTALLQRHLGYPSFRPGQEELVRAVLAGRDALGVLPTGGGKSVCYQIPALSLGGVTLVVTPLVSLMEDQVRRAEAAGLRAAWLSSTQSAETRREVARRAQSGLLDLLFVAPERLDSAGFRDLVHTLQVRLLAIDEAHCISEWGHDFRPSYRGIGAFRGHLRCPALALTATATPAVRRDVAASLRLDDPLVEIRSFDRPNLSWSVQPAPRAAGREHLVHRLLSESRGCAIVYAPTRRSVETLRRRLAGFGVAVEAYHAGLPGEERSRVQDAFMADRCRVVVATNAFGMGIDKPDVRLVIHAQLPTTLEGYYQEAGRAGRDGRPARCVALHHASDRRLGEAFLGRTHPPVRHLKRLHRALARVADDGVTNLADPRLRRALPDDLDAWLRGDPVGPLGALERVGALHRLPGEERSRGTRRHATGSQSRRAGVLRRPDWAAARRLRRRGRVKLGAVRAFAQTRSCRRRALLRYFGEDAPERCGRCDRCATC